MRLVDFANWPIATIAIVFVVATLVIFITGTRITYYADRLADATGLGEAMFGAILLGATTSLPGIITSVWTAHLGYPELSVSNAVGGIAVQTAFLAIADMTYRHANLEHAAASLENLIQAVLLVTLLTIPLLAMTSPEFSLLGVHPASIVLLTAYFCGQRLVATARATPLWKPKETRETHLDKPELDHTSKSQIGWLWLGFLVLALLLAIAGFTVAQTGIVLANRTALSETVVGTLLTAIATSLPELVTTIAAVRRGALTLAVGGIIGGNSFDVLFIAAADFFYTEGSIYHAISQQQVFIIVLALLLTGILLLGLLRREKSGVGNIGFESVLMLALYLGGVLVVIAH
ncbi:MAG: sodium:calcium antiporter [Candidatus Competibacteraceae bacterium]|jgi:cation:H+ antiporter|nr:sodium:calcium antiporter [Candidatus Competibacteraceae bacterium]